MLTAEGLFFILIFNNAYIFMIFISILQEMKHGLYICVFKQITLVSFHLHDLIGINFSYTNLELFWLDFFK